METVFIALGSNLGNRGNNLREAIAALEPHVAVQKKSRVYESLPQGVGEQSLYLNMVVSGETELAPRALLEVLQKIERDLGRAPNSHNMPRVIDLDILLHGDTVLDTPELTLPHPRMQSRAFVIVPLEEIAPFHTHPVLHKPIIDLWDELGVYSDLLWPVEETI